MGKEVFEVACQMAKADAEARAAFEKDPSVEVEFYFAPSERYIDRPRRENHDRLDPPENMLYRLKPEPAYRPYTSEELPELVGKVVKRKDGEGVHMVVACKGKLLDLGEWFGSVSAGALLDLCTYMDGTPCGVRE